MEKVQNSSLKLEKKDTGNHTRRGTVGGKGSLPTHPNHHEEKNSKKYPEGGQNEQNVRKNTTSGLKKKGVGFAILRADARECKTTGEENPHPPKPPNNRTIPP